MTKFLFFLLLPIFLFGIHNPYENLNTDEKINLLVNYFLNKELKTKVPPPPIKEKIEDDGPINPIKYELYFSYIQRLRAINESRKEEQQLIDEKYEGKVGFYNGKLNSLRKYYNIENNLHPILQNAFNRTYKVMYGKPKLKKTFYDKKKNKVFSTVWVADIYGLNKWEEKNITIDIPKELIEIFVTKYRTAKVQIQYNYHNNILKIKDLVIKFEDKQYKGNFVNKINKEVKLNIKTNDDIFRPIKLEDKR